MQEVDAHVLDTNVVLAIILPNDGTELKSNEYFNVSHHDKYFSNTACKEAKNVINKSRRVSLKIINCIKGYMKENLINFNNVNIHYEKIKQLFFNMYQNEDFPEKMKKERFENMVNTFFEVYTRDIKIILIEDNVNKLDFFSQMIKDTFKALHEDLKDFLLYLKCVTIIGENHKLEELHDIGIHNPDRILINETFSLSLFFDNALAFITFDNGILNFSEEIVELFSSKIYVLNPVVYSA